MLQLEPALKVLDTVVTNVSDGSVHSARARGAAPKVTSASARQAAISRPRITPAAADATLALVLPKKQLGVAAVRIDAIPRPNCHRSGSSRGWYRRPRRSVNAMMMRKDRLSFGHLAVFLLPVAAWPAKARAAEGSAPPAGEQMSGAPEKKLKLPNAGQLSTLFKIERQRPRVERADTEGARRQPARVRLFHPGPHGKSRKRGETPRPSGGNPVLPRAGVGGSEPRRSRGAGCATRTRPCRTESGRSGLASTRSTAREPA